jgi:hypothetical protein
MADQFLTIKDLAAREGTDLEVGLVEAVVTVAPELERVMGRVIRSVHYEAKIRKAIPGNSGFRRVNGGVNLSASTYTQVRFNTMPFDCQLQIDEAELAAAEGEGDSMGLLMADEASGAVRSKAISLGRQFYNGLTNDSLGHPGLVDFIIMQQQQMDDRTGTPIDQVIDASGSAAGKCETVWFVHEGIQGIHWLFGNGQGLKLNPWYWQKVTDANGKSFRAYCSNLFGFVGLSMANFHAIGCIRNVDASTTIGSTTAFTDAMVAELWSKFPIGLKPTAAYASQRAIRALQLARSVTLFANADRSSATNSGGAAPIAPWPTELPTAGGIPIIPTDSIQLGNQVTIY